MGYLPYHTCRVVSRISSINSSVVEVFKAFFMGFTLISASKNYTLITREPICGMFSAH